MLLNLSSWIYLLTSRLLKIPLIYPPLSLPSVRACSAGTTLSATLNGNPSSAEWFVYDDAEDVSNLSDLSTMMSVRVRRQLLASNIYGVDLCSGSMNWMYGTMRRLRCETLF
jgi:hypothetical protein